MAPVADVGSGGRGQGVAGDSGRVGAGWREPRDCAGRLERGQGGQGHRAKDRAAGGLDLKDKAPGVMAMGGTVAAAMGTAPAKMTRM